MMSCLRRTALSGVCNLWMCSGPMWLTSLGSESVHRGFCKLMFGRQLTWLTTTPHQIQCCVLIGHTATGNWLEIPVRQQRAWYCRSGIELGQYWETDSTLPQWFSGELGGYVSALITSLFAQDIFSAKFCLFSAVFHGAIWHTQPYDRICSILFSNYVITSPTVDK